MGSRRGRLGWIGGWGVAIALTACTVPPDLVDETALAKIGFDLEQLDEEGLVGPPGGKRALDYEFCLPKNNATYANEVRSIDPSLTFYPDSAGRIGCTAEQTLAIGNTHQQDAREVLMQLANLDYIERIAQVDWE